MHVRGSVHRIHPLRWVLAGSVGLLLVVSGALADYPVDPLNPDGLYNPNIPTQESVLGFPAGERPVTHAEVVTYLKALAAGNPRVRLETYGKTHEGRELILFAVSSVANWKNRDEILSRRATFLDARQPLGAGESKRLAAQLPAVAFLAYSIHGDEFSGTDAALRMAYELAASRSPGVVALRDDLFVLIDPLQNPDGRERILAMNRAYAGAVANPDPGALSHQGVWPWGRGNHYFFDLNRDGFALVQPESRARVAVLDAWQPELIMDAHEMGSRSTFLFSPPRAPFNPHLPQVTQSLWEAFAEDEARAFDRQGWSYFSGEWFEEFFPGRGRAVWAYLGTIDVLHEQASTDGQSTKKPDGRTMSYLDAVRRQFTSSLSNLNTLADKREELLLHHRSARVEAMRRAREGKIAAWYFSGGQQQERALELAERLQRLGIEVEWSEAGGTLGAARTPWDDAVAVAVLPPGSFRVRTDQPAGLLVRSILDPHVPTSLAFQAEERLRLEQGKGTRIYDVTAWSWLLASGVDAFWGEALDALPWKPFQVSEPAKGRIAAGSSTAGWLWDGGEDQSLVLASELAAAGLSVRIVDRPFRLMGRDWAAGTFLLRPEDNSEGCLAVLERLALPRGVVIEPVASARPGQGPDLGGSHWRLLTAPRIGIIAGAPSDSTSVGAMWNLLDAEMGLRVSLLDVGSLGDIDLRRYSVLVLPHARGGRSAWKRALDTDGLSALRAWVQAGGTFVGIGAGAELAAMEESKLSRVRSRRDVLEEHPSPRRGLAEAAVRTLGPWRGTGLQGDEPSLTQGSGAGDWPAALGIPGPGSPLIGTGARALMRAPRPAAAANTASSAGVASSTSKDAKKLARTDARLRRFMPSGAILRADLDQQHWLSLPIGPRLPVLSRGGVCLLAGEGVETVGRFAGLADLHLGGLLWPEAAGRIARTAWLTRERRGKGQLILFAADPCFRGYFWGTERLFLNAVLLGPGLGTSQSLPW